MSVSLDGSAAAGARLLVVDDSRDMRLLLRHQLERDGDGLTLAGEARDGREAVDLAATVRPDVVLLDVEMPRLDGIRALPALRAAVPDARIVMYSARRERLDEALAAGAHAWVDKGAPWPRLRDALLDGVAPTADAHGRRASADH